jgi:hypothetical protein
MRIRIAVAVIAVAVATAAATQAADTKAPKSTKTAAAAPSLRDRAVQDGWPDTPAGLMAFEWTEAFSSGEKAMQKFYETRLNKESLAKRPMSERLDMYRSAREKLGTLTLAEIEESNPAELTAALLAEDATRHRFVFKVQPEAPYYLISVSTFDTRHGGHGH